MVARIQPLASAFSRPAAARWIALSCLLLPPPSLAPAAPPAPPPAAAPYVYAPRAHIVRVQPSFVDRTSARLPGAGVRTFQDPGSQHGGTERFDIRWYANPPGLPPGVVILLESLQKKSPVIKNHVLQIHGKSEGHVRSVIEIPAHEIQRAGRVLKWRVRIIWRGRLLASQASDNWDG